MNTKAKELLDNIKKPKSSFDLLPIEGEATVNLTSHVGGKPFMGKHEHTPQCHTCQKDMSFILQLCVPHSETTRWLHTFYYCFQCQPIEGNKGFAVKSYLNPDMEQANMEVEQSNISHSLFEFELYWSLPDWESLNLLHPEVSNYFYSLSNEEYDIKYEEIKEEFLELWNFDSFSFYGGYPNFLNESVFPTCDCCEKPMKLWMQIDSYEGLHLHWNNHGALHIFRCEKENENFKIIIQ